MRARIALLEGEKRGNEGAMRDLGRRCKMLENALRGERSKFLSTTNALASVSAAGATPSVSGTSSPIQTQGTPTAPPAAASLASKLVVPTSADMAPSSSSPGITISSTLAAQQPPPAAQPMPGSRASSSLGVNGGTGTWGGSAAAGRDPRGRARSRDYLKQCLQEITYLTSSTTLNPLAPSSNSAPNVPRPRKTLPDLPPPSTLPATSQPGLITLPSPLPPLHLETSSAGAAPTSQSASASALTNFPSEPASAFVPLKRQISQPLSPAPAPNAHSPALAAPTPLSTLVDGVTSASSPTRVTAPSPLANTPAPTPASGGNDLPPPFPPPSSPASKIVPLPTLSTEDEPRPSSFARRGSMSDRGLVAENGTDTDHDGDGDGDGNGVPGSRLTAIFRPESDEKWREQLQRAGERAKDVVAPPAAGEEDLDDLRWEDVDEAGEDGQKKSESGSDGEKNWDAKRTLRSHLESVRTVAFGDEGLSLVSGGDDMTVKLWRLDPRGFGLSNGRSASLPETEPVMTYRAHTGSVTSVLMSSEQGRIYSASLDTTINVWKIPPAAHETYGPFDASTHLATLSGHTNAVWALAFVGDGTLLASASADGTVKLWDTAKATTGEDPLVRSWDYGEVAAGGKRKKAAASPAPTSLAAVGTGCVAVAYQDSVVKIFDVDSGKEVLRLKSDQTFDGTPGTQINHIVTHPTLPIIVTAHEDKYIRVFDSISGECTRSMITHLDGVTSIDLDPTGRTLVSVGHDSSLRFWDLETLTCVREIAAHRNKSSEGILDIRYHRTLPFVATAGADGTVKLWG